MPKARGYLVKTVVFDQALYSPRGDVNRWVRLVTTNFGIHTREEVSKITRSGALLAGIETASHQVGVRQVEGVIESRAPHTMYVLRGTTGPIMTDAQWKNPTGAIRMVWGYTDPRTKKVTRKKPYPGARRTQHPQGVKGHWIHLRADDHGPSGFYTEVAGQAANNFLLKAWRATARNHKAIRGKEPLFITNP